MDKKLNDKYNPQDFEEKLYQDFTGFQYLALWSKKGAPFVCIEKNLNVNIQLNFKNMAQDLIITISKEKEKTRFEKMLKI